MRASVPKSLIRISSTNALAAAGVSAEEAVHVGDTYGADIVGAQGVGIRPILLDRDGTQTCRWSETIQSLTELPGLLISPECSNET